MSRGIHWFRNDLRLTDNLALATLAERVDEWLPVYVLDPALLESPATGASRVRFLLATLERLSSQLERRGVPLLVRRGRPARVLPDLLRETGATVLSHHEDTTPFARRRDAAVRKGVEAAGGRVLAVQDRVVFGADEIRTGSGGFYSVYSPYRRAWWRRWDEEPRLPRRMPPLRSPIPSVSADPVPSPKALGFAGDDTELPTAGERAARRRLDRFLEKSVIDYAEARDFPALDGTSRLSPYLRFGAISVRECFGRALDAATEDPSLKTGVGKWLDELVWREFYAAVLAEQPRVLREPFRREYEALVWDDAPEAFEAWQRGRTGFPFVDAGMRQLAATGWMHNRARMVAASFLAKDLLVDWRLGERHFQRRLIDADPASNDGGWQWAASTGTDAQPYFRIFNPTTQGTRYDPDGDYVRRWVPELRDLAARWIHEPWKAPDPPSDYPRPVVDHAARRVAALARYKRARERAPRAGAAT